MFHFTLQRIAQVSARTANEAAAAPALASSSSTIPVGTSQSVAALAYRIFHVHLLCAHAVLYLDANKLADNCWCDACFFTVASTSTPTIRSCPEHSGCKLCTFCKLLHVVIFAVSILLVVHHSVS
jgi:hypothetical protein